MLKILNFPSNSAWVFRRLSRAESESTHPPLPSFYSFHFPLVLQYTEMGFINDDNALKVGGGSLGTLAGTLSLSPVPQHTTLA